MICISLLLLRRRWIGQRVNPHRSFYIHLLNLRSLFEFCIPAIQDYGVSLKSNHWPFFRSSYRRLLRFFLSCSTRGVSGYQASMLMFSLLEQHWAQTPDFCISRLFRDSHSTFSEESGDIALSLLATSQPPATKSTLKTTSDYWLLL